jgi:hypothetical protein
MRRKLPWLAGLVVVAVIAAGVWLTEGRSGQRVEADARAGARKDPVEATPPSVHTGAGETPTRLAMGTLLSLDSDALPFDEDLALALELPDEARGEGPRDVRVLAPDGRELKTTATPLPGAGSGVQLAIDPGWLRPGRYLIEVQTAEQTHFPLRRYVLEIQ